MLTPRATTRVPVDDDFLPDLLGSAGNGWNVRALVDIACADHGFCYAEFRSELGERSTDQSYEDLLALIEEWFGPQDAIAEYRRHVAALDAGTLV